MLTIEYAPIKITRIGETTLTVNNGSLAAEEWLPLQESAKPAEHLIDTSGRCCYQSYNRPNPDTETTGDYISRTIHEQQHWSIAEHVSVSFMVEGISRAALAEWTRHRHFSFSVISQRYVDVSEGKFVLPEALKPSVIGDLANAKVVDSIKNSVEAYTIVVKELQDKGFKRKEAREAARAIIPNAAEVKMVVTANLRAWNDFLGRRDHPAADREMQKIAKLVREELHSFSPHVILPNC